MRNTAQKLIALLLVAVFTLSITGCAPKFDASAYMQAEMDLLTRHDIEQYMNVMDVSEQEAMTLYEEALQNITVVLDDLKVQGLPDDLVSEYEIWMIDILNKTKYTVLEAKEVGEGFLVPIEIEPIRAFANVSERLNDEVTYYMDDLLVSIMNGGTEPTEEEINRWVYTKLLEIVNDNLENPIYREKQTFEIAIEKNADGLYEPNAVQATELGQGLIDLSDINDVVS